MPQLDKLSFSTQYVWLTLFFFALYFICTNFFVILVFKNLKLRRIIYKVWYFFVYKFDYSQYEEKNKKINSNSFNAAYSALYLNLLVFLKGISVVGNFNRINSSEKHVNTSVFADLKNLDVDEI